MKLRSIVLFAIFFLAAFAPGLVAGGRRTFVVTTTGTVRALVPIGWESVMPFPRTYSDPLTCPRVIGWAATIEATDAGGNVVYSAPVSLPDIRLLTTPGGALPAVVFPFDGFLNYAGTSGFVLLEPTNAQGVKLVTGASLHWRVVGAHFVDPEPLNPSNAFGPIPTALALFDVRAPFVDESDLHESVGTQP